MYRILCRATNRVIREIGFCIEGARDHYNAGRAESGGCNPASGAGGVDPAGVSGALTRLCLEQGEKAQATGEWPAAKRATLILWTTVDERLFRCQKHCQRRRTRRSSSHVHGAASSHAGRPGPRMLKGVGPGLPELTPRGRGPGKVPWGLRAVRPGQGLSANPKEAAVTL